MARGVTAERRPLDAERRHALGDSVGQSALAAGLDRDGRAVLADVRQPDLVRLDLDQLEHPRRRAVDLGPGRQVDPAALAAGRLVPRPGRRLETAAVHVAAQVDLRVVPGGARRLGGDDAEAHRQHQAGRDGRDAAHEVAH